MARHELEEPSYEDISVQDHLMGLQLRLKEHLDDLRRSNHPDSEYVEKICYDLSELEVYTGRLGI